MISKKTIEGNFSNFANQFIEIETMKKIANILFSTRLTGVLLLTFAAAMGIATFIENDYGTQTAKALVYNAWWF